MIYNDIKITLWNANGLTRQAIHPIINLFSDSTLLFFTETWLLSPQRYATDWIQHHTYGLPTNNNNRGQMGITLLINPKCPYPVHIIPSPAPYILSCQIADLVIHCVYLPPYHTFPDLQAIEFLENLSLHHTNSSTTNTIICGDFNARDPRLTGDHHSNSRGTAMRSWIAENRLLCWNAELGFGKYTFFNQHHDGREEKSIIDLFFSTHYLTSPSFSITTLADLGSQHKPVHLQFTTSSLPPNRLDHPRQLWHLGKLTDNKIYHDYIQQFTTNISTIHHQLQQALKDTTKPDIEQLAIDFTDVIHKTLDQTVQRKSSRMPQSTWFWTEQLDQAFNEREFFYKRRRNATGIQKAYWIIKHEAARKNFKALITQRRRQTWKEFCHKLASDDFSKTTASIKRIRQNRNIHPCFTDPAGPQVAADRMKQHLHTVFAGSNLPRHRSNAPLPATGPHHVYEDDGDSRNNTDCPFTNDSIKSALEKVASKKAPGIDHLRKEMLSPIQAPLIPSLTLLFKICWKWSYTPSAWRVAQVIPIYKKGDPSLPSNYRPISLTSVLRKVMEICLTDSIHSASPPLDIAQGGFRPQRSALDQALCLHELVQRHARAGGRKRLPSLVFLDIKSAYDTVDRAIIWRALEPLASPALLGLIQNLFDDVSIEVVLSGVKSHSFHPKTGVLQGSILSPHLYSLYINSLPSYFRSLDLSSSTNISISPSPSCSLSSSSSSDFISPSIEQPVYRAVGGQWINCLLYADDVALVADAEDMPKLLVKAEQHSYKLGYRWNPSKCIALHPIRSSLAPPTLQLYGQPIKIETSFNYLGIPFNSNLQIDSNLLIQRNTSSAITAMKILKSIGCNPTGLPRLLATQLYQQFIRPKMEYGLAIIKTNKTQLKKIERSQNQCLRMIFGGHRTSSTIVFRHMAGLPTMEERVEILRAKFLARAFYLPDDSLFSILRPLLRAASHLWPALIKSSLIWNSLPSPPQDADRHTFNQTIKTLRLANLKTRQNDPHSGVLINAARPTLGVDPIFWLPMTNHERSRLLRWRMGWLPGRPITCRCSAARTSRHHLIDCLDIAYQLDLPTDVTPNPIDHLLNKLPRRLPFSPRIINDWNHHWPRLMAIMADIDQVCHPDEEKPEAEDSGQQFLDWINPPPPPPTTTTSPPPPHNHSYNTNSHH